MQIKRPYLWFAALPVLLAAACASFPGLNTPTPSSQVNGAGSAIAPNPATGTGGTPAAPGTGGTQVPPLPGEDFAQELARSIQSRDFDKLRTAMRDRFSFAVENTSLVEVSADEALAQLRSDYLAEGSSPVVHFNADVPAILGGVDPLSLWGPVSNPVRAVYVSGLTAQGNSDGVVVIASDPANGQFFWLGLLVPKETAFDTPTPLPGGGVVDTDVGYVVAKDILNVRSGPGKEYDVQGLVQNGEVARVTGKSADGKWWRIACNQDTAGCWISADPDLTEPTTAPPTAAP